MVNSKGKEENINEKNDLSGTLLGSGYRSLRWLQKERRSSC
jgi:hypothetical protein